MKAVINNPAGFCGEVEKLIDRLYSSYDSPHLAFCAVYPVIYELYVQAKAEVLAWQKIAEEFCH